MDKEAASCPTMEADQSPSDDMPGVRTNEEVGEQRKADIRKRISREKEEIKEKMEVRLKEHNIAHGMKHNERARVAPLYLTFTHPLSYTENT